MSLSSSSSSSLAPVPSPPSSGQGKLHGGETRGKGRFFLPVLIFLLALALHLIFTLVFRPVMILEPVRNENTRYTIVYTEGDPAKAEEQAALKYWLDYNDPSLILMPPEEKGFSVFRREVAKRERGPLPLSAWGMVPQPYCSLEMLRLPGGGMDPESFAVRDLSDFFRPLTVPLVETDPPEKKNAVPKTEMTATGSGKTTGGKEKTMMTQQTSDPTSVASAALSSVSASYPFCTDERGRSVPLISASDPQLGSLKKKKHLPDGTTRLAILPPSSPDLPPEIRILSSCGVPDFDLYAVRNALAFIADGKHLPEMLIIYWDRDFGVSELFKKELEK